LAEAYIRLNEFLKAEETLLKLLKLEDDNVDAWLSLSEVMDYLYGPEESLDKLMEGVLNIGDTCASIKYRAAALFFRCGLVDQGLNLLDEALTANFDEHKSFLDYLPEANTFAPINQLIANYRPL